MNAGERRSHRIRLLYQVWVKSDYNDNAVLQRAILMGVTLKTATSYLSVIKARVKIVK